MVDNFSVYYNEGEGKLESDISQDQPPMSQYLTSKLVADSLMWQQTFRNDSPSPDDDNDDADQSPVSVVRPGSLPLSSPPAPNTAIVLDTQVVLIVDHRTFDIDTDTSLLRLSMILRERPGDWPRMWTPWLRTSPACCNPCQR